MSNDTVLTIVGNLTADPELRYTPAGVAVARFTVASTPRTFDKQTNEYRDGEPLFLPCTAWRNVAEHVAESVGKGSRVIATGRLKLSRWETSEGDKRSAYSLDVDEVGASLRFATATVHKSTHPGGTAPDDPWATAIPTRPDSPDADDAPPF
jgi:single-strand DNA-binding protein